MNMPFSNEHYACGRSSIGKVWWDETKDDPEYEDEVDREQRLEAEMNRMVIHEEDY